MNIKTLDAKSKAFPHIKHIGKLVVLMNSAVRDTKQLVQQFLQQVMRAILQRLTLNKRSKTKTVFLKSNMATNIE